MVIGVTQAIQETLPKAVSLANPVHSNREWGYGDRIVRQVASMHLRDARSRVLVVTHVRIYMNDGTSVFGMGVEGVGGIVSTERLRPEVYGKPSDDKLLLQRVVNTAMHELGHAYGLTHCGNQRCAMYLSYNVHETDRKGHRFCETCQQQLDRNKSCFGLTVQ